MRLIAKRKEWNLMAEHAYGDGNVSGKPSPVPLPSPGTPTLYLICPKVYIARLIATLDGPSFILYLTHNSISFTIYDFSAEI